MPDSESDRQDVGAIRRILRAPTILDLTIALAVIAALSAIAIPYFYSQPRVTLDHAAILMANDLRYTQNEAAICGHGTRVEFSSSGDGYTAVYSSGKPIANPVGGDNLVRQYSFDAIFRGVRLETRGGQQAIEFDRNGFAESGLEVALYYQGGERLIRLESGSGLVTIDGLESEWEDDWL